MSWLLPEREVGHAPDASLVARREQANAMTSESSSFEGVQIRDESFGGVACVLCEVEDPVSSVLYFHGGGYRLGQARSWISFCAPLASRTQSRFVLVDYGLAPEHPFPDALWDVATVYDSVVSTTDHPLFLAGDSAGGGLAAALSIAALQANKPLPEGLILISPWLDLTLSAPSFTANAESDQFFPLNAAQSAVESYVGNADPSQALASPLFGDLTDFPPTLLFAGGAETLLDDALRFRELLEDEGVDVTGYFPAGMQHVWPTLFPLLDESAIAQGEIIAFIGRLSL